MHFSRERAIFKLMYIQIFRLWFLKKSWEILCFVLFKIHASNLNFSCSLIGCYRHKSQNKSDCQFAEPRNLLAVNWCLRMLLYTKAQKQKKSICLYIRYSNVFTSLNWLFETNANKILFRCLIGAAEQSSSFSILMIVLI